MCLSFDKYALKTHVHTNNSNRTGKSSHSSKIFLCVWLFLEIVHYIERRNSIKVTFVKKTYLHRVINSFVPANDSMAKDFVAKVFPKTFSQENQNPLELLYLENG